MKEGLIILGIVILVIASLCAAFYFSSSLSGKSIQDSENTPDTLSAQDCLFMKGKIVDRVNSSLIACNSEQEFLGRISDVKSPCDCCKV